MNPKKKEKMCLMNRIASLPQIYRSEIDKALHKHTKDNKSKFKDDEDEEKEERNSANVFASDLKEFNNDLTENQKVYMVLKEENDDFLEKFYKSEQKKKVLGTRPSFHSVFIDLIHTYKEKKGYIIKDLSKKNKLFQLSPLLLENNKIMDSYKIVQNSHIYPHDLKYLEKLNDIVVERFNVESINKVQNKTTNPTNDSQFITSTHNFGVDKNQKIISTKDLLEQIEDNISSINQTKDLLDSNVLKILFLNKERQALNNEKQRNSSESPGQNMKKNIMLRKNSKQFNEIHKSSLINEYSGSHKRDSSLFKPKLNPIDLKNSNLNLPKKISLKRKQSVIPGEIDKIRIEIEDKVQMRKNEKLEKLVESVQQHEQDNHKIVKYLKERENERQIFKDVNKKIDSDEILKIISDMKKKVENCNLNEFNKEFQDIHVNSGYNQDYLYKIEKLDNKIKKFDYQIIKNMNYIALKK